MKNFIAALFLISATVAFGQSKKITFKFGPEYEINKNTISTTFFGNEEIGITDFSYTKTEIFLDQFDSKTLALKKSTSLKISEEALGHISRTIIDFGGNYYWLHSKWNKKIEKEFLLCDKINVREGVFDFNNKVLFESGRLQGTDLSQEIGKYHFNFNASKTKFLISYRLAPENVRDKENYDKIGFMVFDKDMKIIWKNEFYMPYTEAIMDNSDYTLDEDGNAYLVSKVYDSEKRKEINKETGGPGYHYEIMKFSQQSKQVIHSNINIENKFIKKIKLIESNKHQIIIAATYSKEFNGSGIAGVFLTIMDENGKVNKYKSGYYPIPAAELSKNRSNNIQRKIENDKDYELPNLHLMNLHIGPTGNLLIVFEEHTMVSTSKSYETHYKDIITYMIDSEGKFQWIKKIPKFQVTGESTYLLGFKLIADNTGFYFLYLDNKKNLLISDDDVPSKHYSYAGGIVMVSKLDFSGVHTKEMVFDTRDEDLMIDPISFQKINENQFIGRALIHKKVAKPLLITVH